MCDAVFANYMYLRAGMSDAQGPQVIWMLTCEYRTRSIRRVTNKNVLQKLFTTVHRH